MPDDWETQHGLNPKDASDAVKYTNRDGYTNIEDYLNSEVMKADKSANRVSSLNKK